VKVADDTSSQWRAYNQDEFVRTNLLLQAHFCQMFCLPFLEPDLASVTPITSSFVIGDYIGR
jgi:hypothetical protein